MWIFIWILLSIFVLGVSLWSIRILYQQKSAWKAYAEKMKLVYDGGHGFLGAPSVAGSIGAYGFGLYTEEQKTSDTRAQRFNTVLEIALRRGLPETGALGTGEVMNFAQSLRLDQTIVPQDQDWDSAWLVRTRHAAMMEQYLTPARLEVFKKIFRMKVRVAVFVFDSQDAVLRIVTSDPLSNHQRLEKIVKGLLANVESLIVRPEEYALLQAVVQSAPVSQQPPPQRPPEPPVEITPASALDDSTAEKP